MICQAGDISAFISSCHEKVAPRHIYRLQAPPSTLCSHRTFEFAQLKQALGSRARLTSDIGTLSVLKLVLLDNDSNREAEDPVFVVGLLLRR